MALYSLFSPRRSDREPVAVRERFSWFAALLPIPYAVLHGLWLALLLIVVVVLALGAASLLIGEAAALLLYGLGALLFGFEAPGLRRAKLARSGYEAGAVVAEHADLALLALARGEAFRP